MEFYYWPGASKWGLPSFDCGSLYALSYIKFCGADISLHPTPRSWLSKEGKVLPSLSTPDHGLIKKPEKIITYLKEQGYNLDNTVDNGDNILPFSSLIMEKLYPAVMAAFWIDENNYKDVIRGTYAKACQYPLNFTIPNTLQKKEDNFVRELKSLAEDEKNVIEQLHPDAVSTLNLISAFLGEKDYLLGKNPSSFDALLFSMLDPLLKIPLTSSKLQNHLKGCLNICHYISRINQKYFQGQIPVSIPEKEVTEEYSWKYDWVFPVTVAGIAMFSYAVNVGLLHNRVLK